MCRAAAVSQCGTFKTGEGRSREAPRIQKSVAKLKHENVAPIVFNDRFETSWVTFSVFAFCTTFSSSWCNLRFAVLTMDGWTTTASDCLPVEEEEEEVIYIIRANDVVATLRGESCLESSLDTCAAVKA